jgi:hypothetical protein
MFKKSASFVGAPVAVLSWCNGSHAKRLNGEGVSPFAKIYSKDERITRSADETRNSLVDFSSGVNPEGLRPMSRWFTRSAVCTSSPPRLLRPRPWKGASRRDGVGRVRMFAFLNILDARTKTLAFFADGAHLWPENSFSSVCNLLSSPPPG